MPRYIDHRTLPYPVKIFYEIVADVERYPHFLPGIRTASIISRTEQGFIADLTVGYGFFQETYRSDVRLFPYEAIEIQYIDGPFKYLQNSWQFSSPSSQSAMIDFLIDFEFKSSIFQGLAQNVFSQTVTRMIAAFEDRARMLSQSQIRSRNL